MSQGIPYSPEEIARMESYYGGTPGVNMSSTDAPMSTEPFGPPPPPPVASPVAAPPPPPVASPAPAMPPAGPPAPPPQTEFGIEDPNRMMSVSAPMSTPPAKVREPSSFVREFPAPVARPGGAGGKPNADPYGILAAQRGRLGAYDARQAAAQHAGAAEADKATILADGSHELARRREEDAVIAGAEQELADKEWNDRMARLEQQMDDVRSKKVDPLRATKDLGILAVLGGVLGGIYMGINRMDKNPFIEDLNRKIERDIDLQQKEIDNAKHGIGDKMNLLAQQRSQYKDSQAAKMATKAMYYEAAQEQLRADAARSDSELKKAAAEDAWAQLEGEKQALKQQIGEHNRALAAQQASAAMSRRKEVNEAYRAFYDKLITSGATPEVAEYEADRQVGRMYSPQLVEPRGVSRGVDPIQMVPKDQRTEAVKEYTAHANKEKVQTSIQQAYQQWRDTSTLSPRQLESTRSSITSTIMQNVPGVRSDTDFKEIVEPNLPARGDSEETLRMKQNTLMRLIESGSATPILDAHAPGWRKSSADEQKATFGAKKVTPK